MLLLIACSLSMLVIYAGLKLMILTKKEDHGVLFRIGSWFVLVMGFVILFGVGIGCVAFCLHGGRAMMKNQYKMHEGMNAMHMGGMQGMMGGPEHMMMMQHHMMGGCCPQMSGCSPMGGMRGMHGMCHSGMHGCMEKESCCEGGGMEGCEMMKGGECSKDGSCKKDEECTKDSMKGK